MSGLLFLEPLIIARLREKLPQDVHIGSAPEAEELSKMTTRVPAVFVVYGGGQVPKVEMGGFHAQIIQTWLVVPVVRHAGLTATGRPARADAGPLADACLSALMGWIPAGTADPFTLIDLPEPGFLPGLFSLPLAFTTKLLREAPP